MTVSALLTTTVPIATPTVPAAPSAPSETPIKTAEPSHQQRHRQTASYATTLSATARKIPVPETMALKKPQNMK